MATRLKDTDVVIIGLGAAGRRGRAAAGAGRPRSHRSRSRDVADQTRLRAGRAAQQLSRLAAGGAEGQPGDPDVACHGVVADRAARQHPSDAERGRRHDAALLGAELAAEPVGLQGGQRNDDAATARRASRKGRPSRTGRSATTSSSRTTTRSSTRSACPGRPATSTARSIRAATSSKAPRKRAVSDAAAARHGVHREDGRGGEEHRLASVSGSGRDQLAHLPEPLRLHVSRLLQPRRLPRRRQELDGGDDDSAGAGDRPPQGRHPRARDDDRGRRQRAHDRRQLPHRRHRILPAGEGRAAGQLHLREQRGCCCSRSRRRFPTGCRTITGRSGGTTSAITRARRSRRCSRSISTAGTVCRRRASPSTTGPTTTSIMPASISSAAPTSGRCPTSVRSPRPA